MGKMYDYLLSKSEVLDVLDHYDFQYSDKSGKLWISCPFHNEQDPSLMFNQDSKTYFCWGCKAKGNLITFVKDFEFLQNEKELTYYDSAVKLAKICHVKINLSEKEKLAMEMESIDDISDIVKNDFSDSQQQETFSDNVLKKFYVKKNNYMLNRGFKQEILDYLEMGFYTGDTKNPMNNRCVFPVRDYLGRLIGWTGRSILPNVEPKWLHAPAKRFLKSLCLYNIDKAILHVYEQNEINVVESPGNLIRMLESGKYNTVATLGSTISQEQCELLMSYDVPIIFWYDWDDGGFEGLNLAMEYITDYDRLFVAITDYGINDKGKALDLGDVDVSIVNNTKIVDIYNYIHIMKERYVFSMPTEFKNNKKIKLTDGSVVLCTNKVNTDLETPQLVPNDIKVFKDIDEKFGVSELSLVKS